MNSITFAMGSVPVPVEAGWLSAELATLGFMLLLGVVLAAVAIAAGVALARAPR